MLVLSRKKNEGIIIGDDVHIVIVDIRSDKVRLGIDAPVRVAVHREEVAEAIRREQSRTPDHSGMMPLPSLSKNGSHSRIQNLVDILTKRRGQLVAVNEVLDELAKAIA